MTALTIIVTEFDEAGSRTSELRDAIRSPQGRSDLREAAEDFESRWDDERETPRRTLEDLQQRVDETRQGWADLDGELAREGDS